MKGKHFIDTVKDAFSRVPENLLKNLFFSFKTHETWFIWSLDYK